MVSMYSDTFQLLKAYYRITALLMWEETSSDHLIQPLAQAEPPRAQECVPSCVVYLQGWKIPLASLGNLGQMLF